MAKTHSDDIIKDKENDVLKSLKIMFKAIMLIAYNIIRIAVNKLIYRGRFAVHPIQRFSPHCSLKLFGRGKIVVGRNTEFAPYCDFEAHGNGVISIGAGTYFNRFCMISAHQRVSIGEHCMFGPGVKIFDNNHRFSAEQGVSSDLNCGDITIGDNCWIASDVIILKGAHIGDRCLIGAGCVISGEIPAGTKVKLKASVEVLSEKH